MSALKLLRVQPKVRIPTGPRVEFDLIGLPWRASTDEDSLYYFDAGERHLWVEFNDRPVEGLQVFEFDRRNGWIRRDNPRTGEEEQLFGRVTARYR